MRNLFVFILMLTVFVSCSKDDNSGNSIKKATVKGAQLIYKNSITTRATTEEVQRFMTVDDQGNTSPIRFITESGDTIDMNIYQVYNLNKEYLILNGNFMFNGVGLPNLLVNKNTENIYGINQYLGLSNDRPSFTDKNNNSYIVGDNNIIKFNISDIYNITMEKILGDNQYNDGYYYLVNNNGTCYYDVYKGGRFRCAGGRIYNYLELFHNINWGLESVFCGFDNHFYVAYMNTEDAIEIHKIIEDGNNELKTEKVLEYKRLSEDDYFSYGNFVPNPINKTHISSNGESVTEFNETTREVKKLNISLPAIDGYIGLGGYNCYNAYVTSESLFILDETKLYQLKFSDYSVKIIDLISEGFEIKKNYITCSIESPGLSFSGLRYSDGQNVVGTISEDGIITANEKTKSGNPVTTLLRLN